MTNPARSKPQGSARRGHPGGLSAFLLQSFYSLDLNEDACIYGK